MDGVLPAAAIRCIARLPTSGQMEIPGHVSKCRRASAVSGCNRVIMMCDGSSLFDSLNSNAAWPRASFITTLLMRSPSASLYQTGARPGESFKIKDFRLGAGFG